MRLEAMKDDKSYRDERKKNFSKKKFSKKITNYVDLI